jgi:Sulfotransferase domain
MYIFCVGMYRSCSTWQYNVVCHLVEGYRLGARLGFLDGEAFHAQDDRAVADDSWLVLKSHDGHERFREALHQGRARAVYAYRDLRDVAFSLIHKHKSTFEQLIQHERWLDYYLLHDQFWTTQPGVLIQRYEDLVSRPAAAIEQIAAYLRIELHAGEAVRLAAEHSLTANRRRTFALLALLRAQGIDLEDPNNAQLHDPHTLLHWNHLREGRVGGWRQEAAPEQRRFLEHRYGSWLVARGYEIDNAAASPGGEMLGNGGRGLVSRPRSQEDASTS